MSDPIAWRHEYVPGRFHLMTENAKNDPRYQPLYADQPEAAARIAVLEAENARLREALAWYGEQARLCRLIHREGDTGRYALDADGGKRASAALTLAPAPEGG